MCITLSNQIFFSIENTFKENKSFFCHYSGDPLPAVEYTPEEIATW